MTRPARESAAPEDLGLDPDGVATIVERLRAEVVPNGVLPAAQIAIARHGRLAVFETLGAAGPTRRFHLYSVTKAVMAAAAWIVLGDGDIDETTKVADVLDGFGANGKADVTVEHLLTHTAGFPRAPLGPPTWADRDARLAKYATWRLDWEPGSQMAYHATSAHWVLADVLHAVTGIDHRDLVHERVSVPLGIPRLRVGATDRNPDDFDDVLTTEVVGRPPTPEEFEAVGLPGFDLGEVTDDAVIRMSDADVRPVGVPGGGGVATAADVALFYQGILHDPDGLWDPVILADGTGRLRVDAVDPLLGVPANRTLGLQLAGAPPEQARRRGFGRTVSPATFGHLGAGAQVGWADPATGISFCFVTNGYDRNLLAEGMRLNSLNNRVGALAATASAA